MLSVLVAWQYLPSLSPVLVFFFPFPEPFLQLIQLVLHLRLSSILTTFPDLKPFFLHRGHSGNISQPKGLDAFHSSQELQKLRLPEVGALQMRDWIPRGSRRMRSPGVCSPAFTFSCIPVWDGLIPSPAAACGIQDSGSTCPGSLR